MKIYIAADHGGFELKNKILSELQVEFEQHEFVDLGAYELDPADDYPDFAEKLALSVANDNVGSEDNWKSLGILICRSGNGMCVAANKVKGVYAAFGMSPKHAQMARLDDNSNVICLDSDYDGEDPLEIAKAFIEGKFAGMDTRHGRRFNKVKSIELK